jgi:hypothetical protein
MGLLEELIILVKDSIDEANQRGKRKPAASAPERTEEEIDTLRRTLANRAAQARAEQEQAEQREAAAHVEQERHRQAQERERHRQKQAKTVQATQVVQHPGAVDPRRIARLVRHPNALREMMVLREVLDKPLALRRRR